MVSPRVLERVTKVQRCLVVTALCAGCGLDPEGGLLSAEAKQLVRDHEDSSDVLTVGSVVAAAPTYVLSAETITLADAVAAQATLATLAEPAGCLTVETVGNRVTYTMTGCTGPWGRYQVSGAQTATFSPGDEPRSFLIEIASEDVTVNGFPLAYSAAAGVSFGAGEARLAWTGSFSGTASDGREVEHDADVVYTFPGDGSVRLSGSTSTTIGMRSIEVEIAQLVREGPVGTCPRGTVTLERRLGSLTVTLSFDGTNEYVAKTSRGGRGTFDLECTPPGEAP
jgi:hypothetical protein